MVPGDAHPYLVPFDELDIRKITPAYVRVIFLCEISVLCNNIDEIGMILFGKALEYTGLQARCF